MDVRLDGRIVERKGCPIHFWVGGPEPNPLVVFTHGAGIDHRSFDPHVRVVARNYRVLTWDVRGHGLSRPMGEPFSIQLAVEDLLAILDSVGAQPAVLVGHSNGSYISQELAFRYPDRVQSLVVADGTCITWPRSGWDKLVLRASSSIMALLPERTLKTAGLPYFSNRQDVRAYAYDAFSMIPKSEFLAIWDAVTRCLHDEPGYRVTQPLLLVHGDQDGTGDIRKIAPLWAAATPNCQYEIIPNASHMAPMDNPAEFSRLLLAFLAKWAPVTPA